MNVPRIRVRILRHKWKNYHHGFWLLMFQSHWPLIKFNRRQMKHDSIAELLDCVNTSSFDMILEHYDEKGGCGKKIWEII